MNESEKEKPLITDHHEETKKIRCDNVCSAMHDELKKLKYDERYRVSDSDIDDFYDLFTRYVNTREHKIIWDNIKPPNENFVVKYEEIEDETDLDCKNILNKLAVLKLNGGLGTTMGCVGPKSSIHVRGYENFIDMSVKHVDNLNKKHGLSVPLILMNSYNTERVTNKLLKRYSGVRTFTQSIYPRMYADSLLPVSPNFHDAALYPPGHGNMFSALLKSGQLDELIKEGKEYLFVSNIDNLAATVDLKILNYIIENKIDFLMEVTNKTRADIKGGTLVEYDGELRLLEIAQVASKHKSDFTSVRKFKIFNTNSVWINLKNLKELLVKNKMPLDLIENRKVLPKSNEPCIQLETAIGSAIKYFEHAKGMIVPRSRFLPVKNTSDLFLVQSNIFIEKKGSLIINPKRIYDANPIIRLVGPYYKNVNKYLERFDGIPDILELDHLTISGNVRFGKNVVLKGSVIIIADENSQICIPDGAILHDVILYGNLPIIDH